MRVFDYSHRAERAIIIRIFSPVEFLVYRSNHCKLKGKMRQVGGCHV